ncbi:ATP-dependent RNA helicase [Giardia muris]|uniref:ATP-dependent RNA helicase n=1 Tax=Giardia muris TaxID=5742 RepID=A0A4Z1SVY4_GIAMU|nr:ATP-dependent RNA helicase [Giardia muris]|eukprot:TNJ27738.1 ATP-dependent RNA helicase [Giardia muris]
MTSNGDDSFEALPISPTLKENLQRCGFVRMTRIQQRVLPLFHGQNTHVAVLGISRTGSGKTLSFLIPLLQRLINAEWQKLDGLGALILLPTRELCVQTFTVLQRIGKGVGLSLGLITGGHSIETERKAILAVNVLIATPGRLLQHLEESSTFSADNLKILILDEVDNLIEAGFYADLHSILQYLPRGSGEIWAGFFTATESELTNKAIKRVLKHLSIPLEALKVVNGDRDANDNVSDASHPKMTLPPALHNIVTTVHPADKLDVLFSFLRSRSKHKTVVFTATVRQASFIYEAFRRLGVGLPIFALTGKMKTRRREETFIAFSEARNAVLITTDVCARGVDLPVVHWVVQLDCPDSIRTFVHRVGRAARMDLEGCGVLFLTEQEQGFKRHLDEAGITYSCKTLKLSVMVSIRQKLAELCIRDPYMRHISEKALLAYAKSIHVQQDRSVFPAIQDLDLALIGQSYGLPNIGQLTIGKRPTQKKVEGPAGAAEDEEKKGTKRSRLIQKASRQNQQLLAYGREQGIITDAGEVVQGKEDDLLRVTRVHGAALTEEERIELETLRKPKANHFMLDNESDGDIDTSSNQSSYSTETEGEEKTEPHNDHALTLRRRLARTDEKDRQAYIQVNRQRRAGIQEDLESSYDDESEDSVDDEPRPKARY